MHHAADVRAFRRNLKQDPTEESGSSGSGEEETATTHPPVEMSCEACAHEILNTGSCGAFDGMEYSIILWTCGEGFRSDDGCDEVVRGICLGDPTEESGSSGSGEEETATTHPPMEMSCEECAHEIVNNDECGNFDIIPNTVILQRCGQVSYAFDPACEEVVRGLCLGDPTEESGSSGSGVEETATTGDQAFSKPETTPSKKDFFAAAKKKDTQASKAKKVTAMELTRKVKVAGSRLAGSRRRAPSL